MWPGKQKQPPLLKGWYVHGNNLRGDEWSLRAFASISSTAIFLRASTSRDKKNCFPNSEQFREYNSRAASTSYIFRLQQSMWKSSSIWGSNLERPKFFEASLSGTLSRSNQLQSRLMPNDVTFSLHFITHVFVRIRKQRSQEEQPHITKINNHISRLADLLFIVVIYRVHFHWTWSSYL